MATILEPHWSLSQKRRKPPTPWPLCGACGEAGRQAQLAEPHVRCGPTAPRSLPLTSVRRHAQRKWLAAAGSAPPPHPPTWKKSMASLCQPLASVTSPSLAFRLWMPPAGGHSAAQRAHGVEGEHHGVLSPRSRGRRRATPRALQPECAAAGDCAAVAGAAGTTALPPRGRRTVVDQRLVVDGEAGAVGGGQRELVLAGEGGLDVAGHLRCACRGEGRGGRQG